MKPDLATQAAENLARARAQHDAERAANDLHRIGAGDELADILRRGAEQARSPEAIAAFEASIADSRDREQREHRAATVRKLEELELPVPSEVIALMVADRLPDADPEGRTWEALQRVKLWLRVPSKTIVLIGDPGHGKTVAAAYAAWKCLYQEHGVRYVKEGQLAMWSQHVSCEPQMADLRRAALVIVDEIGTATPRTAESAIAALTDLVDTRIGGRKRTVVCGNVPSVDVLVARYGVRLADRLRAVGQVHEFRGPSRRRTAS
jgi:DNA replication protein DnaC